MSRFVVFYVFVLIVQISHHSFCPLSMAAKPLDENVLLKLPHDDHHKRYLLDGEMAVDVDGVKMLSEGREAVFDAGVGMVYDWDDGAYVGLLGISTQQGREIEGYSASVELKVAF